MAGDSELRDLGRLGRSRPQRVSRVINASYVIARVVRDLACGNMVLDVLLCSILREARKIEHLKRKVPLCRRQEKPSA
jgi:hypothetical protein